MRKAKRVGLVGLLLIIALVTASVFFQRPLGQALFERAIERNAGRDNLVKLPDGLHVGLCGTGSPLPNRDRAGACNVVIAGKAMFVVDAGEGGARNIALMRLPNGDIRALFITHFHSDHIDGMGPMMMMRWAGSKNISPPPSLWP